MLLLNSLFLVAMSEECSQVCKLKQIVSSSSHFRSISVKLTADFNWLDLVHHVLFFIGDRNISRTYTTARSRTITRQGTITHSCILQVRSYINQFPLALSHVFFLRQRAVSQIPVHDWLSCISTSPLHPLSGKKSYRRTIMNDLVYILKVNTHAKCIGCKYSSNHTIRIHQTL